MSVFGRHVAPYDEAVHKGAVGTLLHNRVGVGVHPARTVTWDHRKLG